jgi:N-acetylglucosaminyldiphosphoundecaprenol N-acetyl-beta-D-mannosaminyltransferase
VQREVNVLGSQIHAGRQADYVDLILEWAQARESRVVCFCNGHSVVTANRDPDLRSALRKADLRLPDGASVAWLMRRLGSPAQDRIDGPGTMWSLSREAAARNISVCLVGSTHRTLRALTTNLLLAFPHLRIIDALSPPFRPLSEAEERRFVNAINACGAGLVFVSLGCPKQEKWMVGVSHQVSAVMLGVGAAFDYHAGTVARAPEWMQRSGLEWFWRLLHEPRRLWKRYFFTNTLFVLGALQQLLRERRPL